MNRSVPPRPAGAKDPRSLKIIGLGMAGGVVAFCAVAIGLAYAARAPAQPPSPLAWALCGAALVALAAGWALPAATPSGRIVTLALREACGLLGAVITILTGSATWAAALGLLSLASILAGVAAVAGQPETDRHTGGPRLG